MNRWNDSFLNEVGSPEGFHPSGEGLGVSPRLLAPVGVSMGEARIAYLVSASSLTEAICQRGFPRGSAPWAGVWGCPPNSPPPLLQERGSGGEV